MPKYESQVPLPERFHEFIELLESAGTVGPITYSDERGGYWVSLTYEDDDLWEASKSMTGIELDDRYSRAFEHESVEFISKPVEVFPPEDVRHAQAAGGRVSDGKPLGWRADEEPRTERVYMTEVAAAAASLPVKRGDGATLSVGSDRYPYTITDVVLYKSGGKQGKPRYVRATLDDAAVGSDDIERYVTRHDREPEEFLATDQPGVFKSAKGILRVGKRSHYLAPEF